MTLLSPSRIRLQEPRRRRWLRWGIEALLVLLAIGAVTAWQTRKHIRNAAAPSFTLQALSGATVTSDSLRGKPVMLVLWAPWCGVCKLESRNVGWVRDLVGDRAHVLSIAASFEERSEVEAYVRDQGVYYPVLLGDDSVLRAWRVDAFPTVYFLDEHGNVKRSVSGYTTTFGMLWRLLL